MVLQLKQAGKLTEKPMQPFGLWVMQSEKTRSIAGSYIQQFQPVDMTILPKERQEKYSLLMFARIQSTTRKLSGPVVASPEKVNII